MNAIDHGSELLERGAEARALAGGGFKQAAGFDAVRLAVRFVESTYHGGNASLFATGCKSTWVRYEIRNSKSIGANHFENERVDRLFPQRGIGTRQVDEVGVMRERMRDTKFSEPVLEERDVVVGKFFGLPLVVVLGEQLDAVAVEAVGDFYGFVVTAGDGLVGSEDGHVDDHAVK